jgi:putative nucleotidyltransferase with HDIG domain
MRNMMEGSRFGVHIDVEGIVPTVEGIIDSIFRNQDALLPLAQLKKPDEYTFHHSVSVCALLVAYGRSMKLPKEALRDLALGGILHDIGNSNISDSLINKPGKLSDDEFAAMKAHVSEGIKLVSGIKGLSPIVMQVITEHHERLDGSGYPAGKAGKEISLYGQMAGIVDVYDAISSNRPYHRGMSPTQALKKLLEWSDHHFDPQLVHSFIRAIGIYPSGTLVKLESNRMGIVLEQNTGKLLEPVVKVFYHAGRQHYIPPEEVDLSKGIDRVDSVERFEKWNIDPAQWLLT